MNKSLGIIAFAAVLALPTAAFAATYAYVNSSGNVSSVEATDANTAILTAPGIDVHSGVILLTDTTDDILK